MVPQAPGLTQRALVMSLFSPCFTWCHMHYRTDSKGSFHVPVQSMFYMVPHAPVVVAWTDSKGSCNIPVESMFYMVRKSCGHCAVSVAAHRNHTNIVWHLCSLRTEMVPWLCDCCVFWGIHAPSVYNFSFLLFLYKCVNQIFKTCRLISIDCMRCILMISHSLKVWWRTF